MDYERKYKDALQRARVWKDKSGMPKDKQGILDDIFPELKESEDERIRKCVKYAIDKLFLKEKIVCDVRKDDVLAWLEKQGEQKLWSEEDEKEYKYVLKFVDNILNNCGNKKDYEHCKRCYDWLKSLKPQNRWKPSENELEVLRLVAEKDGTCLMGLYENLKKLREE